MRRVYSLFFISALVVLLVSPSFGQIDINTASQSELESLSGIGPVKAERIIAARPFRSVSDINRVKGIGPKTYAKIKDQITCGSAKKEKKEVKAVEPPKVVPVYSTASYQTIKCWKCKNISQVSSELKSGWCPYCDEKWAVK